MRHQVGMRKLGRETSHRLALLRNLATDLLRYERIETTEAKAKELQPYVEGLITLGKQGSLNARRQVSGTVYDPVVVQKLFSDVGPRFAARSGGYTRIYRMGRRKGDAAPMALIELVAKA
jgi:large subunit ribosomal protein L17